VLQCVACVAQVVSNRVCCTMCCTMCCNTLQCMVYLAQAVSYLACCSVLQCFAVCCRMIILKRTEENVTSKRQLCTSKYNTLQHSVTHCTTLQHTTTHRNTPQHTATHRNTPQHTATRTLQHVQQRRRRIHTHAANCKR